MKRYTISHLQRLCEKPAASKFGYFGWREPSKPASRKLQATLEPNDDHYGNQGAP